MTPWLIAVLIVGLDRLTKLLIQSTLVPGQSFPLIPSIVHLTYVQNTGAAFGLFHGQVWWLAVVSMAVCGWIVRELRRSGSSASLVVISLSLVLGGAIGNLIDRVWLGYVVDFVDLRVWPVFNVADSCITIGVGLLLWQSLFKRQVTSD